VGSADLVKAGHSIFKRGQTTVGRWRIFLAVGATVGALLGVAGPGYAGVTLDAPTSVAWVGPGASWWIHLGTLKGFTSDTTSATALVYTYSDDGTPPAPTPETVHSMSPLGQGTTLGSFEAWGYPDEWLAFTSRTFAVYATDGAGNYSAPTLLTVDALTESPTDPGPIAGLTMNWTWTGGEPSFSVSWPTDLNVMGAFLSVDADNPAPDAMQDGGSVYRNLDVGSEGASVDAYRVPYVGLPNGTPLTLTVFRENADLTHFTREVHNLVVGRPTSDSVTLTGPSTMTKLTSATFTATATSPSCGCYYTMYPEAQFTFQTRLSGAAWATWATVTSTTPQTVQLTMQPRTQGYQVRAVLDTGGANLVTSTHTVVLTRKVKAGALSHRKHGTTVTLAGTATGRKAGQSIEILRCVSKTGACSVKKTIRLRSDERYSTKVRVPSSVGSTYWYRVRLPAIGSWTPRAKSKRVYVTAT
jgi:hypothetical protein